MSIFGKIMSSIFGTSAHAEPAPSGGSPGGAAAPKTTISTVDVAAILDKLASESDEDLDWRRSIVDLMKLLKLESNLATRKALANELKYTGNMKDSAAMNIWLHKQVMTKLAENGGKVPAELKD